MGAAGRKYGGYPAARPCIARASVRDAIKIVIGSQSLADGDEALTQNGHVTRWLGPTDLSTSFDPVAYRPGQPKPVLFA